MTPFGTNWINSGVFRSPCDGFVLEKIWWIWELGFLASPIPPPPWLETNHTSSSPSVVWSTDNCSSSKLTSVGNGYNEGSSHLLTAYQMDCVLCHQSRELQEDDVYMGLSSEGGMTFLFSMFYFFPPRKFAENFSIFHCYCLLGTSIIKRSHVCIGWSNNPQTALGHNIMMLVLLIACYGDLSKLFYLFLSLSSLWNEPGGKQSILIP